MQWQSRNFCLLFIWMVFCDAQVFPPTEHLSDIVIAPANIVIDSPSSTKFLCTNYRSNESELVADLSKTISSDHIKISTTASNKTTKQIQLDVNNYIGCFHLLCYVKGQRSDGIYADVIVKAPPGILQLVQRCQVHDRQYLKCIIRAPVIASAIQNGCLPRFKFEEDKHPSAYSAYKQPPEFLLNESTKEVLVFKFRPTTDGEFPNHLRMNMTQMLRYFEPSWYIFDVTPIFIIKPKFIVKNVSPKKIQINLTAISPPAFCERSITQSVSAVTNRTWTVMESERNSMFIDNLLANTMYRVCIKCRQVYSDPGGLEECQEIKTLKDNTFFWIIVILTAIGGFILLTILILFYIRKKKSKYEPIPKKIHHRVVISNRYDLEPNGHVGSSLSLQSDGTVSQLTPLQYSDENGGTYLPIASAEDFISASFPKILQSPNS